MSTLLGLIASLATFTYTVVGVNSFLAVPGSTHSSYDISEATGILADMIVGMSGAPDMLSLPVGVLAVSIPAMIVFFIVRGIFGGGRRVAV